MCSAFSHQCFTTISGNSTFPADAGSGLDVSADKIVDSLKMTFMGSLDAHNGRWGAFTDLLYVATVAFLDEPLLAGHAQKGDLRGLRGINTEEDLVWARAVSENRPLQG